MKPLSASLPISVFLQIAALTLAVLAAGCTGSGRIESETEEPTEPESGTTLSIVVDTTNPQSISSYFYGQNYWNWVRQWGGAALEGTGDQVATLGIQLVRAGGINNDKNNYDVEYLPKPEPFDNVQLEAFVAYTRAVGAEPLLQLPVLRSPDGNQATAATALEMIRYANQTQGYGLRFFSIGNEPDMYVEAGERPADFTVVQACDIFASYAAAVRAEVPDAVIIGPDLAWKFYNGQNDWLSPFLADCAQHLDVVAVHRYPFESHLATDTAAFADVINFRRTLAGIRAKMAANGAGDKPLAITEANVGYSAANDMNTASPGTFAAGLWTADIMGAALEEGLWNLSFWHISDSLDQKEWTLGFYHGGQARPAAHAYKLVSDALRTQMYRVSGATADVSVYAGNNAGRNSIVAINKSTLSVRLEVIGLSSIPATFDVASRSIIAAALSDSATPEIVRYAEGMIAPSP
jgi:hypothetical protein